MDLSLELYIILLVACSISSLLSMVTLVIASLALAKVIGVEKSTHSVQMIPVDPDIDAHNQRMMSDWAMKEENIDKQDKMFKEDLEEQLPEFYEEEKEVYSY